MARMLVLDVHKNDVYEKECSTLQDYYGTIQCNCIDIVRRKIGERWFDVIVDDEGWLKPEEEIFVSAIDSRRRVDLVGTLIFANHDDEGNETDLSDMDIEHIRSFIKAAFLRDGTIQPMLTGCEMV